MSWKRIKIVSRILRKLNPRYSTCEKCGLPWNHCTLKSVKTSGHASTFATCDICWDNSTLEELKEYYAHTYFMQNQTSTAPIDHTLAHLLECVEAEYKRIENFRKRNQ